MIYVLKRIVCVYSVTLGFWVMVAIGYWTLGSR